MMITIESIPKYFLSKVIKKIFFPKNAKNLYFFYIPSIFFLDIKLLYRIVIIVSWFVTNDIHATPIYQSIVSELTTNTIIYKENNYLEMYNRTMHGFNQWLFSWFAPVGKTTDTIFSMIPTSIKAGSANFISNLINEPLTIVASLLGGDQYNVLNSAIRFIMNTIIGFGGIFDVANHFGYPPDYRDLGLAMCKYGVPAGPHIIVPLVGPRTLRDGTSDVVLVNALYLTVLATFFGTSLNTRVIIGIILMETIGDLALVRQMDSLEINEMNDPYEIVRDRYLRSREIKCLK
ncbi:phospholipid-binding lipoprotein MlaA [Gammaproteobacteria bacterium]